MSKSYDISKNFSSNQKASMKDQFDYSPAQTPNYNYKEGIVGGIRIDGIESKGTPMYTKMEDKMNKRMARMEQAREMK